MLKTLVIIILAFVVLAIISYATISVAYAPHQSPRQTKSSIPIQSSPAVSEVPTASASATEKTKIKVFMVKIADNGPVGCGDFVFPIEREIPKTPTVLKAALDELVSIRRAEYAKEEYYSGFYSSQLKVESASITDGIAKINLTGTLSLGGVCDSPRVMEQLIQTAKQFPSVKDVQLFYNDKPLKDVLSEKG